MDWRWVLLSLAVAVVAAVRLRRRAPDGERAGTAPAEREQAQEVEPDEVESAEVETAEVESAEVDSAAVEASGPVASPDQGTAHATNELVLPAAEDDQSAIPDDQGFVEEELDGERVFDVESVDAALERVWAEHAHDADTILDARLRQLVARKVPVRAIRRAPGGQAVRVAFADGTVLLCRGRGQGDFGRLGLALHRHSVRLATFAHVEDVTRLEFAWNPDHRLAAVAVGLDQPD